MLDWLTRWLTWGPTITHEGINLVTAGIDAVHEADRIWQLDVIDPKRGDVRGAASRSIIDQMIRSKDGLGWSWLKPYEGDGQFEWCGAFAAYCWARAGLRLHPARYNFWASTDRLVIWARYERWKKEANARPKDGPHRMLIELNEHSTADDVRFEDGTQPRAGDILIVGGVASGPGKHITLVDSFESTAGTFRTYEGNAHGPGPAGNKRQGVVKAMRPTGLRSGLPTTTYHARWVIRVAPSDIEGRLLA